MSAKKAVVHFAVIVNEIEDYLLCGSQGVWIELSVVKKDVTCKRCKTCLRSRGSK